MPRHRALILYLSGRLAVLSKWPETPMILRIRGLDGRESPPSQSHVPGCRRCINVAWTNGHLHSWDFTQTRQRYRRGTGGHLTRILSLEFRAFFAVRLSLLSVCPLSYAFDPPCRTNGRSLENYKLSIYNISHYCCGCATGLESYHSEAIRAAFFSMKTLENVPLVCILM